MIRQALRWTVAVPQLLLSAAAIVLFAVAAEFMGPCWPINQEDDEGTKE